MFYPKTLVFLLLHIFFTLVPHGVSSTLHAQMQQASDKMLVVFPSSVVINGDVGREIERILVETAVGDGNSSMILADKRTRRRDPSNDFEYYTGGWNISDQHYIYSVSFTAAPLFAIAAIWFVGCGVSLLLVCCCYCCCRRNSNDYSKTAYAFCLCVLSLFTISAIVGCVVLYTGQGKFHESTTDTLDYVVSQSNDTVYSLKNVSSILSASKDIAIDQVSLPSNVKTDINRVHSMINDAASKLQFETRKNEKDIKNVLKDVVLLARITVSCLHLGNSWLDSRHGYIDIMWHISCTPQVFLSKDWNLTTTVSRDCSIVGDTCVAMNEWVENPMAHTALDDILPCVDNSTAQETMSQSKEVEFQLVEMVNTIINNISNINPQPSFPRALNYNQSGPLVPTLCNPLTADKTDRTCQAGELQFDNATKVWRNYVCQVSPNDTCTTTGRLTPKMYQQMSVAVNVTNGLTKYGPFMTGLLDCSFVRETFIEIHKDHCPDLNRFSEWVYIGLAVVSSAVMLSLVLWVLYGREKKHRRYNKLMTESEPNLDAVHREWK
ncbi:hypothetical protein M8C21_033075 [Ambrosia artemisiifolia]|uniref:Uncharacterized protein n=1 Tax=Ambrosia artemisiifolia TaxID=4212 RepID=A0AAD5GM66_AMBAR|nr:hypothetical protein M8C21_033075 [Ambrosia artemisiifolia]